MQYVEGRGWDQAGEGDWNVRLERYLLCADGKYHAVDFFDRRQAVTATPIYVRSCYKPTAILLHTCPMGYHCCCQLVAAVLQQYTAAAVHT